MIPHRICKRQEEEHPEQVNEIMELMIESLAFEFPEEVRLETCGLNLLVCKEWLMMVPITQEYATYGAERLFWEPWSYLGFFSLPVLQKTWPETSDLSSSDFRKSVTQFVESLTSNNRK